MQHGIVVSNIYKPMDTCYIWQWLKAPKPQSSAGLKPVQCWYRSKGFFSCCRETKSDINSPFAHISLCHPPRQLQIQLRQSTAALCSVYASLCMSVCWLCGFLFMSNHHRWRCSTANTSPDHSYDFFKYKILRISWNSKDSRKGQDRIVGSALLAFAPAALRPVVIIDL